MRSFPSTLNPTIQTLPARAARSLTALFLILVYLSGCSLLAPKQAGIGESVSWSELPGWQQDALAEAWPALLAQCVKLAPRDPAWSNICRASESLEAPDDQQVRQFFQHHFLPHEVVGTEGRSEGLITGYYEPTLYGSLQPDRRFSYPIYARPAELLTVELDTLFPALKGKRVRGRVVGNKVIPFYERADIDGMETPLKGNELLWIDDPYGSFFLQIQGSGRVKLPDESFVKVGYADQNGHQYVSIGKTLIERGELQREAVSLFTIRQWLEENPDKAMELLNQNPSYVFFTLSEDDGEGPRGSLNVPLTPERSAAVDRSVIPLGTPIWLSSSLPGETINGEQTKGPDYQRLLFAQDTGGAITGPVRADVFFGNGDRAEQLAGNMKQSGRLYALLPKPLEARP